MDKKDKHRAVSELTDIQNNPTECVQCDVKRSGMGYGHTEKALTQTFWREGGLSRD